VRSSSPDRRAGSDHVPAMTTSTTFIGGGGAPDCVDQRMVRPLSSLEL
jgi:hypothetical protein